MITDLIRPPWRRVVYLIHRKYEDLTPQQRRGRRSGDYASWAVLECNHEVPVPGDQQDRKKARCPKCLPSPA